MPQVPLLKLQIKEELTLRSKYPQLQVLNLLWIALISSLSVFKKLVTYFHVNDG